MEKKTIIYAVDLIFVVGTVLALIYLVGYATPRVIAPIDNLESSNNTVLFEFLRADKILIDDNKEFSTPIGYNVKNNLEITLQPGKYYWKVLGASESEIREFTILSTIDLEVREKGDGYEVVNAGNTQLDVEIYYNGTKLRNIVLDKGEKSVESGDKFIGVQNE